MADGGLRQIVTRHLPPPAWHWQPIETGGTGRGIPDSNGCCGGVEVWVEFKQTGAWAVGLRPEQVSWLERRARAGGRVFVMTRRWTEGGPRSGAPVDELWVHRGADARLLCMRGLRDGPEPLLVTRGGPAQWAWDRVHDILTDRS